VRVTPRGEQGRSPEPAPETRVYEKNEAGITRPVVVSEVKPQYTAETMRAKIQGTVTLSLVVFPDGRVGEVKVVESLDPVLDAKAIEAAWQWRFTPGTKDGRPVSVRVEIEIMFTLR
jgi:protein TonB